MTSRGERLLAFYEAGRRASPLRRAHLLAGAGADSLPIGDVDRKVWAIHQTLFPGAVAAVAQCNGCSEKMEVTLPDNFAPPARDLDATISVQFDGEEWPLRLPVLADMRSGGLNMEDLSLGAPWSEAAFVARAEAALEAADPGMHVQLALTCHACGQNQTLSVDVVAFLWEQIETAGQRLVADVARLAQVFGWSEAEILSMSSARRALYLERVEG